MLHVLLWHLPPRCVLTFSPLPNGQPVKRLRAPPSKELKQDVYKQKEDGSQNKFKLKIPQGQEHVPRLEHTAPIRLADRNHAHYPSRHRTILKKKDGSMTDFQHTQSDPHGSHRKMVHVLLTHLPPRCALTFFNTPQRATSQLVESSSFQGAQTICI